VDDIRSLRSEMVRVCRDAYAEGLFAGTSGNLSLRLGATDEMLITPTGLRYDVMMSDDIVHMRLDGTVLEGARAPSSEWRMHAVLYEKLDNVFSVFHTHSPYATACAANRKNIPFFLIEMGPFLGGSITCARFENPGTRELGLSAVEILSGGSNACLLASHGVVAVGRSLAESFIRAEYVEDAARIYNLALQTGEPVIIGD